MTPIDTRKLSKKKFFDPVEDRKKGRGASLGLLGGRRASNRAISNFTTQLATLLEAGLPVVRSLRILEGQMAPGVLKRTAGQVAEDVEGGNSFSEALAKHPAVFNSLYENMVRAGEAGGVRRNTGARTPPDTVLRRLADFMEKSEKIRRQIKGAIAYPAVVITFALLIFIRLMVGVVPKFQEIFASLGEELPPYTQALIDASGFMKGNWYLFFLVPAVLFGIFKLVGRTASGRFWIDRIKLLIPIFGGIKRKSIVSRFCRTFGTLLSSGVPILDSLTITRGAMANVVVEEALDRVHESMREGEGIAKPLGESRVFDDVLVNMIDVGEETGELDKMLVRASDTYDDEVDTLVKSLTSILEPILVIVVGGMVFMVMLALFVPLIKLMENIGQ